MVQVLHNYDINLVNITHFPEKNKELLVKLYTLARTRQVGLHQWVVQQSGNTFQNEGKILQKVRKLFFSHNLMTVMNPDIKCT